MQNIFPSLQKINQKPKPYAYYTTPQLWCDPYIAQRMLETHLNQNTDLASRKSEFIDRSVQWIAKHFRLNNGFKICDFGCGPGLYTTRFAKYGAQVTGIDFSEVSISYAKEKAVEKNLQIEYVLQDYLKFTTDKKFDFICMIYCDFCVLSPEQRKNLISKFYDFLAVDGSVLLDVSSLHHYQLTLEQSVYESSLGNGFWSQDPYYAFHNKFKYDAEKLLLDKFTIIEAARVRESYNWLQCYSVESIRKEFEESGFVVTEYYANVAGDPYKNDATEIAVIAQKKICP
jgi:cyclopropane fatty-acyl-phospholipid synthase-like methyltransferase